MKKKLKNRPQIDFAYLLNLCVGRFNITMNSNYKYLIENPLSRLRTTDYTKSLHYDKPLLLPKELKELGYQIFREQVSQIDFGLELLNLHTYLLL